MKHILAIPLLILPMTAHAQASGSLCPQERNTAVSPDNPPMPTIVAYSVNAISDPVAERTRGETSARVPGGDRDRGWLRIDVTLSAPVAAGCVLPFAIVAAGTPQSIVDNGPRSAQVGPIAPIFDGVVADPDANAVAAGNVFERALAVEGNGTDRVAMELPIQTLDGSNGRTHRLSLVLGRNLPGAAAMQLTVDPLAAFVVKALAGPVTSGEQVAVIADQPTRLHPESRTMPVTFSVSPAGLGTFRALNAAIATPELQARWAETLIPARAEARFVAADVAAPTNGEIRVSYAGRTVSTPVTVLPAAVVCRAVFKVTPVPGGVDVTLSNGTAAACPRYTLAARTPSDATPQTSLLRAASGVTNSLAAARLPTAPISSVGAESIASLTPTVAKFRYSRTVLDRLTRVVLEATPATSTTAAVLVEFTPSPAELAVMRK